MIFRARLLIFTPMLYYLLRPVVRLAFQAFYRKIWITGLENVPRGVPLILTANHPTAFVDPCFLACFSGRTLHFMTRGDVFVSRFVRFLLDQVHLIPIYRFHDGYANLRRNEQSFAKARKVLSLNGAVLVMAEGRLVHEKRLRPIQKGAARIGFEAMEKHGLPDVWIQPVALNYTRADRGRTELMVDFAPAFPLTGFSETYSTDQRAALAAVTERIDRELRERVVQLPLGEDERRLDLLLEIRRNDDRVPILPVLETDHSRLERELALVKDFGDLPEEKRSGLRDVIDRYMDSLDRARVSDEAVAIGFRSESAPPVAALASLLQKVCFLPHALPVVLAQSLTARLVRSIDFRSSILLGLATFGWLIWSAITLFAVSLAGGWSVLPWFLLLWIATAAMAVPLSVWKERHSLARSYGRTKDAVRSELFSLRQKVVKTMEG